MTKFYLDHNVAIATALELRLRGHHATTALEIGLDAAGDDEHLLVAAQNNWVLITHNRKDFSLLHDAWRRWSHSWQVPTQQHAGILIVPQSWPALTTASEVDSFAQTQPTFTNTLFIWRPASGWTRH